MSIEFADSPPKLDPTLSKRLHTITTMTDITSQ